MAATDIQYGDFSPVLNTLDFSFLKYVVDKKTGQYEQGLKSVSAAYNNLKKDLTDPVNAQRRDQYLKNAEGQLKKVAATDLSLQENVNNANSIFQPMATDKAFLMDSYYTAANKKELAEMDSWRNSDDMETRKKFNPLIYNWLQSDLDSIKNGKGDIKNYKVQGRKAFAYVDAQDLINKAVKDSGFTVSQDIDGQTYIYNVEGGATFKQNYKTFAEQVLKSNPVYMQQNQILGEATYENIVKQGKEKGLNDQQAITNYIDENYTNLRNSKSNYIKGIADELEKQKKDIAAETNNITDPNSEEGQAKLAELAQRRKMYDNDLKTHDLLKKDFEDQFGSDDKISEEKKAAYMKNFLANPKGFFSENYMNDDVNTFSNIKSQSVKTTIKPNTAYFNTLSAVNDSQRTMNAIQNTEVKEKHEDWLEAGKPKTLTGRGTGDTGFETTTTLNADGTVSTSKKPKKPELVYAGASATDITKTMSTISTIRGTMNTNVASSISNLALAPNGGALGILNTMGVKRENIQSVREYFVKQQEQAIKDPSHPYKPSNEEAKALQDVYSSLFAFAKQSGDQETLKKLRAEYGKDVRNIDFHNVLDMAISNTVFKDTKDLQYVRQWNEHKKNNENITALGNVLKTSIKAIVASKKDDPEFSRLFINRGTDKAPDWDIINKEDVKGWFKGGKTNPYSGGKQPGWDKFVFGNRTAGLQLFKNGTPYDDKTLDELAQAYIDGTATFTDRNVGVQGTNFADATLTGIAHTAEWLVGKRASMAEDERERNGNLVTEVVYNGKLYTLPKIPLTQEKYKDLNNKINSDVPLPEIGTDLKQSLLSSPIWNVNGALRDNIISLLPHTTQYSSNIKVQNDDGSFENASPAEQTAARNALTDPKNVAENGLSVHTVSSSNNGGVSVKVTFAEGTATEQKKETCKYCGRTYYFPIDMVQGTPEVFQAFNKVNDQTEYNTIKNSGKTYDLYNYEKMGIKIQMLPHSKGADTGDVLITKQEQDPATKKYIPGKYKTIENHYDLSTTTFSELKDQIYNEIVDPYLMNRLTLTAPGQAGAAITKDQILKGL